MPRGRRPLPAPRRARARLRRHARRGLDERRAGRHRGRHRARPSRHRVARRPLGRLARGRAARARGARAPPARLGEAVHASCSMPWIFAPVAIGGREYVDGGVWSNTNLDIAPAMRSTQVLCLNPIASLDIALASPFGMLRAIAGSTAALETL